MIVATWIILRICFFALAGFLIYCFVQSIREDGSLDILKNGLKSAFHDCGFRLGGKSKNYSVDVYKWTIDENDEVCEESLERASWPAMDIADWMKEGLPRCADGSSLCGRDCRCKLTRFRIKRTRQHKSI